MKLAMGMVDNCDGKKRRGRLGTVRIWWISLACVAAGQWVLEEWLLWPAL